MIGIFRRLSIGRSLRSSIFQGGGREKKKKKACWQQLIFKFSDSVERDYIFLSCHISRRFSFDDFLFIIIPSAV